MILESFKIHVLHSKTTPADTYYNTSSTDQTNSRMNGIMKFGEHSVCLTLFSTVSRYVPDKCDEWITENGLRRMDSLDELE